MANRDRQKYNDYMRKYILERYYRRRKQAREFLGGKCVRCGKEENLEFDHIDPSSKIKSVAVIWSYSEEMFWEEVNKCQLLCTECHQLKTIQDSGKKVAKGFHGTISTYRHCGPPKCEPCRAACRRAPSYIKRLKSSGA